MNRLLRETRPRYRAACAVTVVFALSSLASARQPQSSTSDAPKKSSSTSTSSSATTHKSTRSTSSVKRSVHKKKPRGQQKIDSERAQAIQAALIREHYLNGEPTGTWNAASEEAMRRYQSDHGWQTKEVPDSRALITLGLGPSKDHLLNPESAMTTGPAQNHASSSAATASSGATAHESDTAAGMNKNGATQNSANPADSHPATSAAHDTPHPQ